MRHYSDGTIIGMVIIFVLAVLAMVLASCTPKNAGEQIIPTFDRTGRPIMIVVHFYDTSSQVTRVYKQKYNITKDIAPRLGFSFWPEWRDKQGNPVEPTDKPLTCEIHTMRPKTVDDEPTRTLGHEMTHCLDGSYHKKVER
jgi:hypothetical protein